MNTHAHKRAHTHRHTHRHVRTHEHTQIRLHVHTCTPQDAAAVAKANTLSSWETQLKLLHDMALLRKHLVKMGWEVKADPILSGERTRAWLSTRRMICELL